MGTFNLIALRFCIAFLVTALVFHKQLRHPDWRALRYGAGLGAIIFAIFVALVWALRISTVSEVGFLSSTSVVMVPLLCAALYRRRPTANVLVAMVIVLAGIMLMNIEHGFRFSAGAIWGAAFRAARLYAGERTSLTGEEFAAMMQAAVAGIQRTGERSFGRGAVVGDKTLIDALVPCADALTAGAAAGKSLRELLADGAKAAVDGAAATADIVARMGRAGVVGERSLGHPDAGAYALGVIFTEVSEKMRYE